MPQTRSASGHHNAPVSNTEKAKSEGSQTSNVKAENDERPQKVQSTLDSKLVDTSVAEDKSSKRDEAKTTSEAEVKEKGSDQSRFYLQIALAE